MTTAPLNAQQDQERKTFQVLVTELQEQLVRQHKTLHGADLSKLANTMARVAPDAEPHNEMDRLVGPFYSTAALQEWLGISRQALDQRARARKLLGCLTTDRVRVYPAWQFTDKGEVISGLKQVLPVLASGVDAPWTWALWLVSVLPGELDGLSPAEWLALGRDPMPVIILARQDAAVWAA